MGIREQPGEVDVERGQLVGGCVVRQLGCNQPGEARSGHVSYVCLVRPAGIRVVIVAPHQHGWCLSLWGGVVYDLL